MANTQKQKDFFISYTGNDKQWAEWIAAQLVEAGYTLTIQAWDFRPGGNFVLDMQQAASKCKRTIAVLSKDYLKSAFAAPEWAAAFVRDPKSVNSTLLPIKVKVCKPTGLLRAIVNINLVGKSPDEAKQILLDGVKIGPVRPSFVPFPGTTP